MLTALSGMTLLGVRVDFWLVFVFLPLLLLLLFAACRPRKAPLTLPLALAADLLCFRSELSYYESSPFLLLFIGVQLLVLAILSLAIQARAGRNDHRSA